MSYILDALKKAESERHLGSVPNLHATAPDAGAHAHDAPAWRKNLPWLLVALLAGALLAYVLWPKPAVQTQVQAVIASSPPQASQAPAAVPEEKPTAAAQPIAAPIAAASAKPSASPAPAQAPANEKPAKAAEKPPTETPAASVAASAKPPAAPTAPAVETPKVDEQSVGTLQDLPANIQRELPQVSVTGYIYAKDPADRSVLINKKLLHEGENIAPDLVLEKMTPKGAILNYKGYRYRVAY